MRAIIALLVLLVAPLLSASAGAQTFRPKYYVPPAGVQFEFASFPSLGRDVPGGIFSPDPKKYGKPTVGVVIVHGVESQWSAGLPMFLAENLADRGYAALVYNGVHASSDFRFSTFEDAVKETADAVAFMKSRGFDRIFLVGHSLGTPMVQYYAGESPDPAVKAVASFGPHISIPEVTRDSLLGPEAYAQFVAESRALVAQGKGNEIKLLPYREGRYIITSAKTFLSYRDVETSKAAVEPQVRKIKIPFAIVYDPTDNIQGIGSITPRASIAERLKAAAVASPKVDILVVPAIKGESPLQAHTLQGNETVATDKIVDWLNSVDLKPAPSLR